ncbi:MAG: hypothetical protein O2816_09415 [Planctomycetota bacterium]|nr:hypothetical protein [Planctomycetota bacterium]
MRLLLLLFALLPLAACGDSAGGAAAKPAGLVILNDDPADPRRPFFFDMGRLEHGTRHELPIRMRNTSAESVKIKYASGVCLCLAPERIRLVDEDGQVLEEGDLERQGEVLTVPAGGLVELLLGVNTRSMTANSQKLAILQLGTDAPATPFVQFEVHLESYRPFLISPKSVQLGAIPHTYGGSGQVEVMTGVRRGQGKVVGIRGTTNDLAATIEYLFVNGEHIWTLTAVVPPMKPKGAFQGVVTLDATDDEDEPTTLDIPVYAQVVDDVGFDRAVPNFGGMVQGQTRTLPLDVVARIPGLRVRLEDVRLSGPSAEHMSVTWGPKEGAYVDDAGHCERWALQVVASSTLPAGRIEAQVLVLIDDEQYPEVRTDLFGQVRAN